MINVSPKSIRRLVDRKVLKASKALRHIRITKKSLEEFLSPTSE
jgi:hypothetical protein